MPKTTEQASKMTSVTLVLASQRSGSTLLCQDIRSLGGLGAPDEYFLDILGPQKLSGIDEDEVVRKIEQGVQDDEKSVGAVKLMVNYAPEVYRYIYGRPAENMYEAVLGIVDWSQSRFSKVNVVAIVRGDVLDQSLSHARARLTDVWHSDQGKVADLSSISQWELNLSILSELPRVLRYNAIIHRVAEHYGKDCLLLSYEELVEDMAGTSARLCSHAARAGFRTNRSSPERTLSKVIKEDERVSIRNGFQAFLKSQVAL